MCWRSTARSVLTSRSRTPSGRHGFSGAKAPPRHVPESDCSKIRGCCARERFSADGAGAPRVCLVGSENVYGTADVIEGVSGLLDVSESPPRLWVFGT